MVFDMYVILLNYLKVFGVDSRIKSSEKEKEKKKPNYKVFPTSSPSIFLSAKESLATSHGTIPM
jgi:hypothetical protein